MNRFYQSSIYKYFYIFIKKGDVQEIYKSNKSMKSKNNEVEIIRKRARLRTLEGSNKRKQKPNGERKPGNPGEILPPPPKKKIPNRV